MSQPDLSCREFTELVTDYLEGRMNPGDVELFELHLSMCPSCVNYVEQMRTAVAMLGTLPAPERSPELDVELVRAFRGWKKTG